MILKANLISKQNIRFVITKNLNVRALNMSKLKKMHAFFKKNENFSIFNKLKFNFDVCFDKQYIVFSCCNNLTKF